ncbi:MAG: tRNA preQ1(34) S-adenosylmethionine ribosyltransferase-isomerase QueA [Leptospirales bacterium]
MTDHAMENTTIKTDDSKDESALYDYDLPVDRIRLFPPENREESRLLAVARKAGDAPPRALLVDDLPSCLRPGDLLVLNDSRVIPARVFGTNPSGKKVEILFLSEESEPVVRFLGRGFGSFSGVSLPGGGRLSHIRYREESGAFEGVYEGPVSLSVFLSHHGEMPLPPYIRSRREYHPDDRHRYQTVYSRHPGSVAAPTAGLHLTENLVRRLEESGIGIGFVTLHVGIGTFRPLAPGSLDAHAMHSEHYSVPDETVRKIARVRSDGGRIVAVGTTVVRTLESWSRQSPDRSGSGWTDLFIRPGFAFQVVDGLLTNFHQPRSTLLVLVDSFLGGSGHWREIYQYALDQGFMFLSYGDALLIGPSDRGTR